MTNDSPSQVLVILNAHPRLDEHIVDWLLVRESHVGFSSFPIRGHSGSHEHLTIAEQVSGRQNRIRFEIVLGADSLEKFLDELAVEFDSADVHYWVTPILASRDLNSDRS